METAHLEQLIQLEGSYWWHVSKRQWITDLLLKYLPPPSRIVEGGVGAAGNLCQWKTLGYDVAGLDCMPQSIEHARSLGLPEVREHDLHEPWPFQPGSSQGVVLLDVLEHLAHPVVALRHAASCLNEQGKIFFTVPAYPWLFSDWDERLGHYRRYTMKMMRQQVADAGLKVLEIGHWNAFTLPAAIGLRALRRCIPSRSGTEFPKVSRWFNRCLIAMADTERSLARRFPIPMGLSIVGVIGK